MKIELCKVVAVVGIGMGVGNNAPGSELNLRVTSGGQATVVVSPCGAEIAYEVRGVLSDQLNEGLAGFWLGLCFEGGPVGPALAPSSAPLLNFDRPAGLSGVAGFGGVAQGSCLANVGGTQNTINNTPDRVPFPIGSVITGVAHAEVVLVTGTVATPTAPGTYELYISSCQATVVQDGETGAPFWATEQAEAGARTPLTVVVPPAAGVTASNSSPVCLGQAVTLTGEPAGMASYAWSGPGGFAADQRVVTVDPAAAGRYVLSVIDGAGCQGSAATMVVVVPAACAPWADCNENGVADECDILQGTSLDDNGNGIPDECELDCNANGVPDDVDIATGFSEDCNENDIPDECDIAAGTSPDFDGDGIMDECDPDMDNDGVPNAADLCDDSPLNEPVNPHGGPLGDLTGDCRVTVLDYLYFQVCLNLSGPGGDPGFYDCRGVFDFDTDNDVDLVDFAAFANACAAP